MPFELSTWLKEIGLESYREAMASLGFDRVERILAMDDDDFDRVGFSRRDGNQFDEERQKLAGAQPGSPASSGAPETLDNLPIYLAIPYAEYFRETHPRIRLHWLCDSIELLVRWSVVVLLAEIRASHGGTLPAELIETLAGWIERPTFGQWLGGLRELRRHQPGTSRVAAQLLAWTNNPLGDSRKLEDVVDDKQHKNRSLLQLRNDLSHGGGLSRTAAEAKLTDHESLYVALMSSLNAAMAGLRVVALDGDKTWSLCAASPQLAERPTALADKSAKTWLVTATGAVELDPLLRYEPVRYPRSGQTGDIAPQCYFRGNRTRQTYIPLGNDTMASEYEEPDFARLFLDVRKTQPQGPAAYTWHSFLDDARALSDGMVGRREGLKAIKAWRKSLAPLDENCPRIGWFHGLPGMGKSMLMAKLADDLKHGGDVYYHRFKGGDSRNNRGDFLRYLAEALLAWPPLQALYGNGPNMPFDDRAAPEEVVRSLLGRIKEIPSGGQPHTQDKPPYFTIIADGLDEIAAYDTDFPQLIKTLALPGSVWVLSSRPGLDAHFGQDRIPGLAQLDPMSLEDVRAMLLQALEGGKARGLLVRDDDSDPAQPPRNRFVESVLAKAEGCPLYVHYVIEDLLAGQKQFREDELPKGLTAYYSEMLDRIGLSAAKERLHHIVTALACSYEPLDADALTQLLHRAGPGHAEQSAWTHDALKVGATLLRDTVTFDDTPGYMLYHTSFRDFVNGDASPLLPLVAQAKYGFCEKAGVWRTQVPGALSGYLVRNGVGHLLDLGRLSEAINLLDDLKSGIPAGIRLPSGHLTTTTRKVARALDDWLDRWTAAEVPESERTQLANVARTVQPLKLADIFRDTYETGIYSAAIRILIEFHADDWWQNRDNIKGRFLTPDDLVARHSVGEALSAVFLDSPPDRKREILDRIKGMSASDNIDEREAAGYAFVEMFEDDPALIEQNVDVITGMVKACHAVERMVLGEMLVYFAHGDAGRAEADKVRFDRFIDGSQVRFWNPIWDYNAIDLADFYALTGKQPPAGSHVGIEEVEQVKREHAAVRELLLSLSNEPYVRHRRQGQEDGPLIPLLHGYDDLRTGDSRVTDAKPALELALKESPETRTIAKNIIKLLFSHPLWTVAEACSTMFASLLETNLDELSLVEELLNEPEQYWRIRYGVVDVSFNVREFDNGTLFLDAFRKNYRHRNARVRGICFDNFVAYLRLSGKQKREQLLAEFDHELRDALEHASDVWELEYLYLLFSFLSREGFDVQHWLSRSVRVSPYFGAVESNPFYRMQRADFLQQIDTIRSAELGLPDWSSN